MHLQPGQVGNSTLKDDPNNRDQIDGHLNDNNEHVNTVKEDIKARSAYIKTGGHGDNSDASLIGVDSRGNDKVDCVLSVGQSGELCTAKNILFFNDLCCSLRNETNIGVLF